MNQNVYDACLSSVSHYSTGFPEFPRRTPVVLDHVDHAPPDVEARYITSSNGVAVASEALFQRATKHHSVVELIENGVNTEAYSASFRREAKRRIGVEGKVVISLIGLTCSDRLYFVDAFIRFLESEPNAVLILVGNGRVLQALREKTARVSENVQIVGGKPYDEVIDYFNATDIGLYPGDDTPYFREAFPLKVAEYTAAGAQVISSPVSAFSSNWPNVHCCDATADAFLEGLKSAHRSPCTVRDVADLSWTAQAQKLERLLENVRAARNAK